MKKILTFILLLIIASSAIFALSFGLSSFFLAKKSNTPKEVKQSISIVNPSLYQLNANAKGKVTERNDEYFVLSDDNGNELLLYYEPRGLTSFIDSNDLKKEIPYKEIEVGDSLSGGISIILSSDNAVGRTGNRQPGDMMGHYFIVTKK